MEINTNLPATVVNKVISVPMRGKPYMAALSENVKIKDYPEEIQTANIMSFITWALNLLGVKGDENKVSHHVAAADFVKNKLDSYTFQELKYAFLMYVSGELELRVLQQFNAVVCGDVMRAYKQIKNVRLSAYFQAKEAYLAELNYKEPTDEEKAKSAYLGTINCFDEYKQTGTILPGYAWIYDHVTELGLVEYTTEAKKKSMTLAKELLIKESKHIDPKKYKDFIAKVEEKNSSKVIVKAKNLLLADYFDRIIEKGLHISNFLK